MGLSAYYPLQELAQLSSEEDNFPTKDIIIEKFLQFFWEGKFEHNDANKDNDLDLGYMTSTTHNPVKRKVHSSPVDLQPLPKVGPMPFNRWSLWSGGYAGEMLPGFINSSLREWLLESIKNETKLNQERFEAVCALMSKTKLCDYSYEFIETYINNFAVTLRTFRRMCELREWPIPRFCKRPMGRKKSSESMKTIIYAYFDEHFIKQGKITGERGEFSEISRIICDSFDVSESLVELFLKQIYKEHVRKNDH